MSVSLRMLRTVPGSVNGRDVSTYEAGQCYELPDDGPAGLAGVFLREGWAARVAPEPVEAAPEKPARRSRRRE